MKQLINKLKPSRALLHVSLAGMNLLEIDKISYENVGHKGFGISSIPETWSLPFIAVAAELYDSYRMANHNKGPIVHQWCKQIKAALTEVGLQEEDSIIVRSSGCSEELNRRGKFYSVTGTMLTLQASIQKCLKQIYKDKDIREERMPLLVQKLCEPVIAKGHLSNERRCYEEHRDWLGEFESEIPGGSANFQINLRKWRTNLNVIIDAPLLCGAHLQIREILRTPAQWATRMQARVHFEWVWNGRQIFIVQADEEPKHLGHNPVAEHDKRNYHCVQFSPLCMRKVVSDDAAKFKKIANTGTYSKLGLPTAPLYILDDKEVLKQLSYGNIAVELRHDLNALLKGSLIIRSDLDTKELILRQLLPRTDEIRKLAKATKWLVEQSKLLHESSHDFAFIFHNFIPAEAAAFAYAHPTKPIVQIESLWGLPEGLYYNAHDKYRVDTGRADINLIPESQAATFPVKEKRGFKRVFVSTTENGSWETILLRPPYDWKGSLSVAACQYIAFQSRRIATEENRAVSIMWFVGVSSNIASAPAIPWYHEEFDIDSGKPSLARKTKSLFDKFFVVRSSKDIKALSQAPIDGTRLTRIKLQPTDEKLLRDKGTLKKIGEIAKSREAILVLEGAVLSHAYYQLLSTGANVEVVNPFIGFDEKHIFNKLVRDNIPDIIRERGEEVKVLYLDKKNLILALHEKLVEEAYELLDASDLDSVKSEIIDIREVVDAIAKHLQISEVELQHVQEQKRLNRGGFNKGVVLLETQNVVPTNKKTNDNQLYLSGIQSGDPASKLVNEQDVRKLDAASKWTDRRVSSDKTENKVRMVIPVTKGSWQSKTHEERLDGVNVRMSVVGSVKGERTGTQWTIELSVMIGKAQEELL